MHIMQDAAAQMRDFNNHLAQQFSVTIGWKQHTDGGCIKKSLQKTPGRAE
jgi:hypothetical protein